jgi:uncharacterized protein YdhG (YjbR/CyaY superfamily)
MKSPEIDSYIKGCPEPHREAISKLRALAHRVAPGLVEVIEYKMPTFKVGGGTLCGMSSRAAYVSLYCDPAVVREHVSGLAGLDVGKSCVRFRRVADVGLGTIERIFRAVARKLGNG